MSILSIPHDKTINSRNKFLLGVVRLCDFLGNIKFQLPVFLYSTSLLFEVKAGHYFRQFKLNFTFLSNRANNVTVVCFETVLLTPK